MILKMTNLQDLLKPENLPKVRGSYRFNFPLAQSTWFGVGGNADVFFKPEDEADLAEFFKQKHEDIPYFVLGVCSNIIIRDGGFRGVIIKLGRNFAGIDVADDKIICGAAALDVNVARYAAENGHGGLEFLVGIPGTIGGAIAMNAGAYGREIKDVLTSATAIDESGNITELNLKDFAFEYRKNNLLKTTGKKYVFTKAVLKSELGNKAEIITKMENISSSREATQPIRSKTGGSTFKNPDAAEAGGKKAWQLVDEAGCRGLKIGGAQVSELHCNFLINTGNASAKDIETLGEEVRRRVKQTSGVDLHWEIKIIGEEI